MGIIIILYSIFYSIIYIVYYSPYLHSYLQIALAPRMSVTLVSLQSFHSRLENQVIVTGINPSRIMAPGENH
jgi:hypothetical protein